VSNAHDELRPRIEDSGFPGRTEIVLSRERNLYAQMTYELSTVDPDVDSGGVTVDHEPIIDHEPDIDGEPGVSEAGSVTLQQLEAVLTRPGSDHLQAAAFVAGRSAAADAAGDHRIDALLRDLVKTLDGPDLGSGALAYVEAAMSLALRGHAADGTRLLQGRLAPGARASFADWLAAFYLAELGDASGWSTITTLLASSDGFTRLMAARHVIGFLPVDGTTVGGHRVDIVAALDALSEDSDPLVAQEIPALLAEAKAGRAGS
jgi:hypothetical protein